MYIKKTISLVLLVFLLTNMGFCTDDEYPKLQVLGRFDETRRTFDEYFYDALHDELYVCGADFSYVVHSDGSLVEEPTFPFTTYRRIFMAFDGPNAAAIECDVDSNFNVIYYLTDFTGQLLRLPFEGDIYNFKIRNGRYGFIVRNEKTEFYDLTKEELLAGSAQPIPLESAIYYGFDYSADGTRIYLNSNTGDWFKEILELDAHTYQPLHTYNLPENVFCIHDLLAYEDAFVTEFVFIGFGASINLQYYSSDWELIGTNRFPWHQTQLTPGPDNSTIICYNTDDQYNELPYYEIAQIVWEDLSKKNSSGIHSIKFRPLIQETNRNGLTEAAFIDKGFGLFHPSLNDPENENARDRSVIFAPLRTTNTHAFLDIPYCDVQETFLSEASTFLIEWNDSSLAIPLESLNCNDMLSRLSCNDKATLRLHLSIKKDGIQVDKTELLTTETINSCTSFVHHNLLP